MTPAPRKTETATVPTARPVEQPPPVQRPAPIEKPAPIQRPATIQGPAEPVVRPQTRRVVPLDESLPVVDSILLDQNRRLAVLGGTIVSVGDRVGSRTVAQIERDFVVLREPSGMLVRLAIRGK